MTLKPLKYDTEIVKHNNILLLRRMRDSPVSTIKRKSGMIPLASLMYKSNLNHNIYIDTLKMYENEKGISMDIVSYRCLRELSNV